MGKDKADAWGCMLSPLLGSFHVVKSQILNSDCFEFRHPRAILLCMPGEIVIMQERTRTRVSWAAAIIGMLVIVSSCFFSIAIRMSEPVMNARDAQRVIQATCIAFATGAIIAIGIPVLLKLKGTSNHK